MNDVDWVGIDDEDSRLFGIESPCPLLTELLSIAKIAQPGHDGLLNAYEKRVYELAIGESQTIAKKVDLRQ